MCGISGLVNCGDRETLVRMTNVQSHRGPDDSGLWERHFPDGAYIGLGSRRLAILDLSADGHMPMSNEDGSVWITYNGEIYNFAELRHELEGKGHRFRSHTDTEAIVHLYEEYGVACLNRLQGMFAIAICDLRGASPKIFLARDHFGIKPLYYCERGGKLAFGSEVKALLEVPGIEASLSMEALDQYLTFLWVPDPADDVRRHPQAPRRALCALAKWRVPHRTILGFNLSSRRSSLRAHEADLADEIRERFCASVEQQMVSDVPIGAFLSAGLDSSSIVAAMSRKQPVRTYTITFPEKYRVGETTIDDPGVPKRWRANSDASTTRSWSNPTSSICCQT
jgi:asparagine synthase (glutamine-hydrolysing)